MARALLKVGGMTCDGCVRSVTNALKRVPGVQDVNVNLTEGQARVVYDAAAVAPEELVAAVKRAEYDASLTSATA